MAAARLSQSLAREPTRASSTSTSALVDFLLHTGPDATPSPLPSAPHPLPPQPQESRMPPSPNSPTLKSKLSVRSSKFFGGARKARDKERERSTTNGGGLLSTLFSSNEDRSAAPVPTLHTKASVALMSVTTTPSGVDLIDEVKTRATTNDDPPHHAPAPHHIPYPPNLDKALPIPIRDAETDTLPSLPSSPTEATSPTSPISPSSFSSGFSTKTSRRIPSASPTRQTHQRRQTTPGTYVIHTSPTMNFKGLDFPGPPVAIRIPENPGIPISASLPVSLGPLSSRISEEHDESAVNMLGVQLGTRQGGVDQQAGESSKIKFPQVPTQSNTHSPYARVPATPSRKYTISSRSLESGRSVATAPGEISHPKRISIASSVKSLPSSPPPRAPLPPAPIPKTAPADSAAALSMAMARFEFPSPSPNKCRPKRAEVYNPTLTITPSSPSESYTPPSSTPSPNTPYSTNSSRFAAQQIQAQQALQIANLNKALQTQRARFEELSAYLLTMAEGFELERLAWEGKVERLQREACGLRWLVETMGGSGTVELGLGVGDMRRPPLRRSVTTPSLPKTNINPRTRHSVYTPSSSLRSSVSSRPSAATSTDDFNALPDLVPCTSEQDSGSGENTPMNTPNLAQATQFDSFAQVEKRVWRESIQGMVGELERWQLLGEEREREQREEAERAGAAASA